MKWIILLLVGLVFFFGCTQTTPEPSLPEENETTMTCEEYCEAQPHIECVGEWVVSGTYPDCECSFECETTEVEEPVEETPEEEPAEPVEEPEPEFPYTDQTLEELLDENLEALRSDFYRQYSGSFRERTYTWKGYEGAVAPGDIVIGRAPASDVKFNDEVIDSIQASGFIVFEDQEDGSEVAYGVAIFDEESTILDSYTGSDTFEVYYHSEVIMHTPDHCQVYENSNFRNDYSDSILVSLFKCLGVSEK